MKQTQATRRLGEQLRDAVQQQFRVDTLVVVRRVGEMQPDVAPRGGVRVVRCEPLR